MPIGVIDYDRPRDVATTPTELEAEYRIITSVANKITVEWYLTLNPDNVPQVSTVTITAGTTGDEYAIKATVGSSAPTYRHKQLAGETAPLIAAFLATLINTNPSLWATSAGAVITIKSLIPGQAFTLANTDSTTAGNVVIATTTANSGTALHRKIAEADMTFSANTSGFPVVSVSGRWYDGAASPALKQTFGPLVGTGNSTLDTIQIAQGIVRPTS
ncbi:hypothetical protein LC605_15925 [Nostoc sp. CHAB 5836]|uniref:hypothetical protein n=1 Tax=Nostoc sp. CHAB 5836 TaxID=2780404 RepID=UPI001E56FD01|nr:hypothetical protein [Nostoc sp. CHAB 5836]MCC5616533.1 hypothetical protein [Nostoc sp. CHAB 5836]